jgi:hypothetical protein
MSCFVASIGKLWGDGGLKDLLIESSVYAAGPKILSFLDTSLGFASTIGAYDTTEYSGLYSERELLYPVQNGIT